MDTQEIVQQVHNHHFAIWVLQLLRKKDLPDFGDSMDFGVMCRPWILYVMFVITWSMKGATHWAPTWAPSRPHPYGSLAPRFEKLLYSGGMVAWVEWWSLDDLMIATNSFGVSQGILLLCCSVCIMLWLIIRKSRLALSNSQLVVISLGCFCRPEPAFLAGFF